MQRPIGYQFLVESQGLSVPPLLRPGGLASVRTVQEAETGQHHTSILYPEAMWPGESILDHLRFALQHEGIQPGVLRALGEQVDLPRLVQADTAEGVQPFHRRLTYMHEFLTGEPTYLVLPANVRYVDLANPRLQFTLDEGDRNRTYRVRDNLLGTPLFCPQVFKSENVVRTLQGDLVTDTDPWRNCPPELQDRIEHYLYHHETQSSWKIEQETPDAQRLRAFVALLRRAHQRDYLSESGLAELQGTITGQRTPPGQAPWRDDQVWVGYTDHDWQEIVVLLGAPPTAIPRLMDGLVSCHQRLLADATLPPVVHAACVSFSFVYIHPFGDGNGRTHRFLLHNVLAQRGYLPNDIIFPLSAWLLNHRRDYLASMTPTCQGIIDLAHLRWLPDARLEVMNDIVPCYQYLDLTREVLSLHRFMGATVRDELEPSIDFMVRFEDARQQLERLVDWPYRRLSLFIKLCHQNGGSLSRGKRGLSDFRHLTNDQLASLEACVQRAYQLEDGQPSEFSAY